MSKTKIRLVTLGQLPAEFDRRIIQSHKSEVFELTGIIENFAINCDSDGPPNWDFSDTKISKQLPENSDADFLIAVTNVPLESNYYTRRLTGNRVVFTFFQIKDYLLFDNIPLENMAFRVIYGYSLVYRRSGNRIPPLHEITNFAHDETRGCLFDMNGVKSDIIYSCVRPTICSECEQKLKNEMVSIDYINRAKKEISNISKSLFYRASDYIKNNPYKALLISSALAIILGAVGSILGAWIYAQF